MKHPTLLNSGLSRLIAEQGHTDELTLSDAGLPVPGGVERLDLAVMRGVPSLSDVLRAVLSELKPEAVVVAAEARASNPMFLTMVDEALAWALGPDSAQVEQILLPHAEFKHRTTQSRAVVRTGESQPFANIILVSGVAF